MKRVWATQCFGIVMLLCGTSNAADWTSIKPQRMTEQQLIAEFGAPEEIVATFPWSEWSARWKIRPRTTNYTLRYRSDLGKSDLLIGPGGKADSVEVWVSETTVLSVTWQYGGDSARHAAEVLRSDAAMRFSSPESPAHGSKAGPSGRVFVELGEGNSTVRVVYDLK